MQGEIGAGLGMSLIVGVGLASAAILAITPSLRARELTTALPYAPPPTPVVAPLEVQSLAYGTMTQPTHLEIHLSSRQLLLYRGRVAVKRYDIGIGRPGWETPRGRFRVIQKQRNPTWISPFTNEAIPATDSRNPLGGYWIGFWTDGNNWIGFHGTLNNATIGKAASHGCIHLYQQDLQELFSLVNLGTTVEVVE